ncbi:recombinase family protein [Tsuneonella sp. YG55]|uniref:Recombinase family protein n=1 Tax=Tsuneonella litorea TaxID=2976475 RepID=A0A9X2VYA7_9SPHN|nr:recombinase family protein [Tsuneonella litorea]MCT2557547.1 recombinase family protein [Tsuneonella litorea]
MASESPKRLRCAIYTRKSTEEGLEKAFNSLDAQREACAAYILSQRHEGWSLLPDLYDDGGFTGGNMDRPGLQQLLADVRSGKVDVVVVYKVDRLTRSLADFAKIVEVLDEMGASFVSVTQAFNTTSSMGRLTLNVLLSFAQFEREVISERIRDKVAASKAKGMWMGGPVALGYRVEDRRLVVVSQEAETVRNIMRRYLKSQNIFELLDELERDGIVSKKVKGRDGTFRGGVPFKRGALYHLLSNRLYLGLTMHKGKAYEGQHDAIVDAELFDAVQAKLAERTNPRTSAKAQRRVSLLAGMICDEHDRPMSPYHTRNHGRRYSYYASNRGDGSREQSLRLPAGELDAGVRTALSALLSNSQVLHRQHQLLDPAQLFALLDHCADLAERLRTMTIAEIRLLLGQLDLRVVVSRDCLMATISSRSLLALAEIESEVDSRIHLAVPATTDWFGHEQRLRLEPPSNGAAPPDHRLVELAARGFASRDQLLAMTADELASMPVTQHRHLERTARLAYLAPDIVRAIADGRQPKSLTARKLARLGSLPMEWSEQRAMLGFAAD